MPPSDDLDPMLGIVRRFEFCWLCLTSWQDHGERTGGFYNCNRYRQAKEKGEFDEEEMQRKHARASLERYMHYYQARTRMLRHCTAIVRLAFPHMRSPDMKVADAHCLTRHVLQRWAENDRAKRTSLKQLHKFTTDKMETLSEITATPTSQLKFVIDAWMQVWALSCN